MLLKVSSCIFDWKTSKILFTAHHYLYNNVGILHCDLSLNNILLNRKNNSSEAIGLLIDYDYSVSVDNWKRPCTSRSSSNASDPRTVENASTCKKATDPSNAQSWTPQTVRCFCTLKK